MQVQEQSTGKQLFSFELRKARESMDELSVKRDSARRRLTAPLKRRMLAAAAFGLSSGDVIAQQLATPLLPVGDDSKHAGEGVSGGAGGASNDEKVTAEAN